MFECDSPFFQTMGAKFRKLWRPQKPPGNRSFSSFCSWDFPAHGLEPSAWPKPFSKRISCRGMAADATLDKAGMRRRFFGQNKDIETLTILGFGHSQRFLVRSQGWSYSIIFLPFLVPSPLFSSQRRVRWFNSFCWHNTFPLSTSLNF